MQTSPDPSPITAAELQARLDAASARGGRVVLPAGRYDLTESLRVDAPCIRLDGEVWSYSADPNGVFESRHGTKLRLRAQIAAVDIGRTHTTEGCVMSNFGVQGDITGMDTRPLFGPEGPKPSCGLRFAHTRADQAEFRKLSFCGLSCGVRVERGAEIDACLFDKLNFDGCATGVWFTPGAAYYPRFARGLFADNPFYAFYADGTGANLYQLELSDSLFIRDGGAFRNADGWESAAVCWNNVHDSTLRNNLFDCAGTFWYYPPDATRNDQRQPHTRNTAGLIVRGNGNRILGNTFTHSGGDAIRVVGDDNVLLNNISDANVIVEGKRNQVSGMIFTKPGARLIVREG